jgi:ribose transport system permease protein
MQLDAAKKDVRAKSESAIQNFANRYMLIVLILLLVAISIIINRKFLVLSNINSVLSYVAIYGFAAAGQGMCMLVGEMNLSLGSIASLCPIVGIRVGRIIYGLLGLPYIQGGIYFMGNYAIVVAVAILSGIFFGWFIMMITQKLHISSMIVTLGFLYALDGTTYLLEPHSINIFGSPGVGLLSTQGIGAIPWAFIIFVAMMAVLGFLMKFTKFGSCIYATGGSVKAATYAGINTNRWKTVAFTISGLFGGLMGLLYSDRMGTIKTETGTGMEFYGIAMAAIAGISITGEGGHISKVIYSSAIFYLIINLLSFWGIAVYWRNIFIGVVILLTAIHQLNEKRKQKLSAEI